MKYFDEFTKIDPDSKRFKTSLEKYEKFSKTDIDDIDTAEKFVDFSKWLMDNYSTTSGYQRRATAKRYIDYIAEKFNRETFEPIRMNLAANRYTDDVYSKSSCPFLFYDEMMEFINKRITEYIKDKIADDSNFNLIWDGYTYHQAIYTLIWNGYCTTAIPLIKLSDINHEKHMIGNKHITKGWNYIEKLSKQKDFYIMRGRGNVSHSNYYGDIYLFRHRTEFDRPKKYKPITKDELRSIMTGFQNHVLDSGFAHATEIMYNGAISNFFKTEAAHATSIAVADELIKFTEDYCTGYASLPSRKMMYEHYELYKKNLLRHLMDKYNVRDLL